MRVEQNCRNGKRLRRKPAKSTLSPLLLTVSALATGGGM
jgi:hypothetical protein